MYIKCTIDVIIHFCIRKLLLRCIHIYFCSLFPLAPIEKKNRIFFSIDSSEKNRSTLHYIPTTNQRRLLGSPWQQKLYTKGPIFDRCNDMILLHQSIGNDVKAVRPVLKCKNIVLCEFLIGTKSPSDVGYRTKTYLKK